MSKSTISMIATSAFSIIARSITGGSPRSGGSFIVMAISGTRLQLGRNASLGPLDKVPVSPKGTLRLQSTGMMQGA
jgi:hypothetical protein